MLTNRVVMAIAATLAIGASTSLGPVAPAAGADRCATPQSGTWLTGDTHVHTDHSYDGSLPRQSSDDQDPGNVSVADQIGRAEEVGLDFMPLTDHYTYDQQWDPLWESSNLMLIAGEETSSPHMPVLGAVDQLTDGANPPNSPRFRHLQQTVWDAHAQDAVVSEAHPDGSFWTGAQLNGPLAEGAPTDEASMVGSDVVELWNKAQDPESEIDYAEDRWNHGFRFGVAGASDNHWRETWAVQGPGQPATHVFVSEPTERAILDALRAGRTTISAGPDGPFTTIVADTDGDGEPNAMGGDEVTVASDQTFTLRIGVDNGLGARVLLYQQPGRSAGPLATFLATSDRWSIDVPVTAGETDTWFRVEVRGAAPIPGALGPLPDPDYLLALTSPVFVSPTGPAMPDPEIDLPPDSGLPDGAMPVVGDRGCFAGFADIAATESRAHVVAETHDSGRTSVLYRRLADGEPDGSYVDLSPESNAARWPRVAAEGDDVWVTWQDERAGQVPRRPDIYLRHSADGGQTWEPEMRLTSGEGFAAYPDIALLPDGRPVAVWSANEDGAFEVYARIVGSDEGNVALSPPGKAVIEGDGDDPRTAIHPASVFPSVAVSPGGAIAVAWQDSRFDVDPGWTGHTPRGEGDQPGTAPDNWEILVASLDAEQSSWSQPVRVTTNEDMVDQHPTIAFDDEGALIAVWEQRRMERRGTNLSLTSGSSPDLGNTWIGRGRVAFDADSMALRPRLDVDGAGIVRVVWYDSRSDDWRWRVLVSELSDPGWGEPSVLTGPGNATWPALSDGTLVFTTDRNAQRVQRDTTTEIFLLRLKEETP